MAGHRITELEIQALLPVEHLSPSSVRDFLEDRRKFRKRWIDMDWGGEIPQAMAEGIAYHAGMETYWMVRTGKLETDDLKGAMMEHALESVRRDGSEVAYRWKAIAAKDVAEATANGQQVEKRETRGGKFKWYALGDEEQMMRTVSQLFDAYIEAAPEPYGKCAAVEQRVKVQTLDIDAKRPHLCALKARIDRVDFDEASGVLTIVDYKLTAKALDLDDDDRPVIAAAWVMQGSAYESVAGELADELGLHGRVREVRVVFEHVAKATGVRTSVQICIGAKERLVWSRILRGVIYSLALSAFLPEGTDPYLPSPAPTMSGETEGWDAYVADVAVELGEAEPRTLGTAIDAEALDI